MVLFESLIISDPAALKQQTRKSVVQETNWTWIRDLSLTYLLEEWCFLMNAQSQKLVLITQKLLSVGKGMVRVMLTGKAASWLGISLKKHWDVLSSGSSGRMSKIVSQTTSGDTSALQRLQLLQHPQTYLKHKTWAENELLEDFFFFYHLNVCRTYSLCIKWFPKKKMTETGKNTPRFMQPTHIQWQETLPGCYMHSSNGL